MRYITLLLMVTSFNVFAQTPDINIPDLHAMNMDLLKLDVKMAKLDANLSQIDFGAAGQGLAVTSQSLGQVLSSMSMSSNTGPRFKLIERAQPDATSYIVSNGKIKGAYLEQALMLLKKEHPNVSDMELAKAILAY